MTAIPDVPAGTAITCLDCGDTIRSRSRHDFRTCNCGSIFVDGGTDYFRFGHVPGAAGFEVAKETDE